jgi:hypothetical protein
MSCDVGCEYKQGDVWIDIQAGAHITDASGLLSNGPHSGDLITLDWGEDAEWQPGPRSPYSFDLPLVMKGQSLPARLGNLKRVQVLEGQTLILRRTVVTDLGPVVEYARATVVSAVSVRWELRARTFLRCTLIFQVLQPWLGQEIT